MGELKRLIWRIFLFLLIATCINVFLVYREQVEDMFGFSLYVTRIDSRQYTEINQSDYLIAYQDLMLKYSGYELEDIANELSECTKTLSADIVSVYTYISLLENGGLMGEVDGMKTTHKNFQLYYPDLLRFQTTEAADTQRHVEQVALKLASQQVNYLLGYNDYIKSIENKANDLTEVSIFSDIDSFSNRNIVKTATDFTHLKDVVVTLDNDLAATAFWNSNTTDYIVVILMFALCICFLSERKRNMWEIVYTTAKGRARLSMNRVWILLLTASAFTIILYISNIVTLIFIYGGIGDLSRSAQSLMLFEKLPLKLNIGEIITHFIILRIVSLFALGLFMWFIMLFIRHLKYAVFVLIIFFALEYFLNSFLPSVDTTVILKKVNIFSVIELKLTYLQYLNMNVFNYPLGIRSIIEYCTFPMCLLLTFGCLLVSEYMRPQGKSDPFEKVELKLRSASDKMLAKLPLSLYEIYKVIILQRGLLVIVATAYVASGLQYAIRTTKPAEYLYLQQLEGPVTIELLSEIEIMQDELNDQLRLKDDYIFLYESGEIDSSVFFSAMIEFGSVEESVDNLTAVRDRALALYERSNTLYKQLWILDDTVYRSMYGESTNGLHIRNALLALLSISLLLGGSISFERQSNTTQILKATLQGRKALLFSKLKMTAVLTILVWSIIYIPEIFTLVTLIIENSTGSLSAPVQSLDMLQAFNFTFSIKSFIIFLYVYRLIILLYFSFVVLMISSFMSRVDLSYIVCITATVLPTILYLYMQIQPVKYISFAIPIATTELLIPYKGNLVVLFISSVIVIVVSALPFLLMYSRKKERR